MQLRTRYTAAARQHLEGLRSRLSSHDALLLPSLMGLAVGLLAGLAMVVFRLAVEELPPAFLGLSDFENFEALAPLTRFLLPFVGGAVIGLMFQWLTPADRGVGVSHVLERLIYHDGVLPIRNAVVQFVTGAVSLISGHSAGREGPAIHVGASLASWMGQRIGLPHNHLRILAACGAAGAIAASFNTPLAGVIFAMEVILTEYTLIGFAPIILAAVGATAVSRFFFGSEALLSVFSLVPYQPVQLLYALLIGLASGLLAAGLTRSMGLIATRSRCLEPWQRCLIAGALTGLLAVPAPVIMGIGYDTLRATVEGNLPLTALVVMVVFKLAATSIGLGLGLPGGVIGPTLVIGAGAGSALGVVLALLFPHSAQPPALSALLGMMAMMGATLHAPLAALTALVELVANPDFIFPGMLAVIIAFLATRVLTRTGSVFEAMAHARGIQLHSNPMQQSLRRMAVGRATNERFHRVPRVNTRERLSAILHAHPEWLVIDPPEGGLRLVAAADVARLLETHAEEEIDLMDATLRRLNMQPIAHRSTLAEALRRMDAQDLNALYVVSPDRPEILGVVTRSDVERSYRA